MHISQIFFNNFRNFEKAIINLNNKTLIVGPNDVGKSNLISGLRLIFDKSLSESSISIQESDFFVNKQTGNQKDNFSILIKISDITDEWIIAELGGYISDTEPRDLYIKFSAIRDELSYILEIGPSEELLSKIERYHLLKIIKLRFIKSKRDLFEFIKKEKRHLLRDAKNNLKEEESDEDYEKLHTIKNQLKDLSKSVSELNYVKNATTELNQELVKLSYHNQIHDIILDTGSLDPLFYIDNLNLAIKCGDKLIAIGGDGRNNQILMALWKLRGEKESKPEETLTFYCIEEPEAHLHPHQQRKLANYLFSIFPGQIIITSHSPEIVSCFQPDSIVRLFNKNFSTRAASNGCSNCIDSAWKNFGYRMSILPAESFFSDGVFLVEGPSEILLYNSIARQLGYDLDYYNISILMVDGYDFMPYIKILNAMEIPWVLRTDNDIIKVPYKEEYRLAGLERARDLSSNKSKIPEIHRVTEKSYSKEIMNIHEKIQKITEEDGIFLSKIDLENDLCETNIFSDLQNFVKSDNKEEIIRFMQSKKAINMSLFLQNYEMSLSKLRDDPILKPILKLIEMVK